MSDTQTIHAPVAAKQVQKLSFRRTVVGEVAQSTGAPPPVVIPAKAKLVQKLSALPKAGIAVTEDGLRTDGPTLEEYVAAGYDAESYPPEGYAVRLKKFVFAKQRGTAAKSVFPDGSFYQWMPKRAHGGGYLHTTSMETTDAALAEKLREASKIDSSIKEVTLN